MLERTLIEENGTSFDSPNIVLGRVAEDLIRSNVNSTTEIVESTMSTTDTSSNNSDLSSAVDSASGTTDKIDLLKMLRLKNVGKLIVASLNINSVANKLDRLEELLKDYVDILIILKTKYSQK